MRITMEHKTEEATVLRERSIFNFMKPPPASDIFYHLLVKVQLSEEEKALCDEHDIAGKTLFIRDVYLGHAQLRETPEWANTMRNCEYTVANFIRPEGVQLSFPTFAEAKNFEHELKTVHLPKMKQYLVHAAEYTQTSTTFEL